MGTSKNINFKIARDHLKMEIENNIPSWLNAQIEATKKEIEEYKTELDTLSCIELKSLRKEYKLELNRNLI